MAAAREELHSLYADYCEDNTDNGIYKGLGKSVYKDMFKDAYEVNNVALLSNPIHEVSNKYSQ